MKIKTLLQAPLILEELKRLNIDPTTLDHQTRVKLIDGYLVFEGEKECFVSKSEPSGNSEQLEYYYLKEGDIIKEGDEFEGYKDDWHKANGSIGSKIPCDNYGYRRKIQKNTLPEDGC